MNDPRAHPDSDGAQRAVGVGRSLKPRFGDAVLGTLTRASAASVLVMLGALVLVLLHAAWPAMREYGPAFLVSSQWRPNELSEPKVGADGKVVIDDGETVMVTKPPEFGALPVIYGTVMSSAIALVLAVPLSLGAALFIVRVAPRWKIAGPLSFLIEFLAAIPSIAYGIWGLFVLRPFLAEYVEPGARWLLADLPGFRWMFYRTIESGGKLIEVPITLTGRDMLAGGVILAIMIIPIITAVSRDVLKSVPRSQIEGALALGATWWQSCVGMLRFGRAALLGAVILGLARAAGETMAVTMVIGNRNEISASPFAPGQTMASLLANEFGDASSDVHRASLFYVALVLLVMSLAFNVAARWLVAGKRGSSSAGM